MPVEIPTPASDPAENSATWQVFLRSEGFKGILAISDGSQDVDPPSATRAGPGGRWCQAQNCRFCAGKFPPPALNRLWFHCDKPYEPIVERELCSLGRSSDR